MKKEDTNMKIEKLFYIFKYEKMKTTLEQDIQSFRNIIKALTKYYSVGNTDPHDYWGSTNSDDESNPCQNHCPQKVPCESPNDSCYLLENENPNYKVTKEMVDDFLKDCEDDDVEDCDIFFHLREYKEPDENGNPVFTSSKHWGGTNDFGFPTFTYDVELEIWIAESCGATWMFRFLEPFNYVDDPNIHVRDLSKNTVDNLLKGKRFILDDDEEGKLVPLDI